MAAIRACGDPLRSAFEAATRELAPEVAGLSNAFALAPSRSFAALTPKALDALTTALAGALDPLTVPTHLEDPFTAAVQGRLAYIEGLLDGGILVVTLRDAFPDGDWDEPGPVAEALSERFQRVADRTIDALVHWVGTVDLAPPAPVRSPVPAPPPEPSEPEPVTPRPTPKRAEPAPVARSMPDPEPPTQLEPIRPPKGPSAAERRTRLKLLLAYAGELGIRIKKVPKNPSPAWLEKLQEKLEEIGRKKGIPSPFSFADEQRGTEETMAFVLPSDPDAVAARQQRLDQMLAKAERAGLKLGSIPEQPSEAWLADLEEKLEAAMIARREERRERRERIARQRQERIARLQAYAIELEVDLGRIPPFPTEDWLTRSERRIAQAMLPHLEGKVDRGRAERLASLLARAADADVDLEVPPDPDDVWLGWAESKVDRALGGGAALAIGEDPDEVHEPVPTLFFEQGTVQEQTWVIADEPFTIGRARNNQAQIRHDGQLSRQHCSITRQGDGFVVQDLRSTQGTRLNDQPVRSPTPLSDGDVITIGETHLTFRYV
jgi:hypothetical protein